MTGPPSFLAEYISQADCVFPTRTARFGVALTFKGPLNLRKYVSQELS